MSLQQLEVGRNAVAVFEHHQVADHEISSFHYYGLSVSQHRRPARQQIAQLLAGPLGPVFLDEGEDRVDYDYHEYGEAQLRHARENGQATGHPQHHREEVN